jgi:oligosaccharide repeat unit polymerase
VSFDPRIVFGALWALQIFAHLVIGPEVFRPLHAMTWFATFVAVGAFLCGAQLRALATRGAIANAETLPATPYSEWLVRATPAVLVIYTIVAAYTWHRIVNHFGFGGFSTESLEALRFALIVDFSEDRRVAGLIKVFFAGVALCVYLLAYAPSLSRARRIAIYVVALVSALLTTGRLALLLLFVAMPYLLHRAGLLRARGVVLALTGFLVAFLAIAVLVNKGGDAGSLAQQLSWNAKAYFFGSLSGFDHYVAFHEPRVPGGALLPNPLREAIIPLVGHLPTKPATHPFVATPTVTNAYTAMFPWFHDLGLVGLGAGFLALGLLHQSLWTWQRRGGPRARYVYALSLYPLVMTAFEEAHLSSPGFWFVFCAVPAALWLAYRAHALVRGAAQTSWSSRTGASRR